MSEAKLWGIKRPNGSLADIVSEEPFHISHPFDTVPVTIVETAEVEALRDCAEILCRFQMKALQIPKKGEQALPLIEILHELAPSISKAVSKLAALFRPRATEKP